MAQGTKIKPETAELRLWLPGGEWTEGGTSENSPLCPTGHRPFALGSLPKKEEKIPHMCESIGHRPLWAAALLPLHLQAQT